jgi:hypothetical protein
MPDNHFQSHFTLSYQVVTLPDQSNQLEVQYPEYDWPRAFKNAEVTHQNGLPS